MRSVGRRGDVRFAVVGTCFGVSRSGDVLLATTGTVVVLLAVIGTDTVFADKSFGVGREDEVGSFAGGSTTVGGDNFRRRLSVTARGEEVCVKGGPEFLRAPLPSLVLVEGFTIISTDSRR